MILKTEVTGRNSTQDYKVERFSQSDYNLIANNSEIKKHQDED